MVWSAKLWVLLNRCVGMSRS